jgi:hypothetical protein
MLVLSPGALHSVCQQAGGVELESHILPIIPCWAYANKGLSLLTLGFTLSSKQAFVYPQFDLMTVFSRCGSYLFALFCDSCTIHYWLRDKPSVDRPSDGESEMVGVN